MNLRTEDRSKGYDLWSRRVLSLLVVLSLFTATAWCQTTATVTVNAGSKAATVGPEAYGVDTAVYDGYLTSSGVSSLLSEAGITAIRYPGGSYADIFNFISGTDQTLNGGYFASGDTFNNFMSDVVLPEGGKALITVNYGSNLTASGGGQPSEAASWVQYANVTNNYGIVYWEIGNEIYGNGYYSTGLDWEEDLHDTDTTPADRVGNAALSPTAYGTNAAAFIKAMKAVDPNIKCGVFVNTASYYTNWDQDVLTAVSNALSGSGYTLDFVIVHWYPGGSNAQILASQYGTYGIVNTVAQIRSDISNYYKLSNANNIEIAVTESGAGSVGGIMPALFASDDDLTWFENGASNVEYQELHNGFLSDAGPGVAEGPWYGTNFASTLARPDDNMVAVTSSNALLRAHAVNRTDGKVGVILINEDPNNATTVNVSVSGATLSSTGTEYSLGNANFPGGSTTASEGVQQSTLSGLGNNFTVTVPAYTEYGIVIPTGVSTGPTISSLSPTSGAAGASVTISGTNFGASQGSSTVSFGGSLATVSSWSNTSITVTVPSIAAGAVNVTVNVSGASSNAASFTVNGVCTPTAITPYIQVNGAAWQQSASASVTSNSTVNLGPQPIGGTWSWTGPNGFTSTAREIDGIPLTAGANNYVAMYTNASSCKSTQIFVISVGALPGFSLVPSATTLSVAKSNSGSDTITVKATNGFTGSVTLSTSTLPTGVTASFATNPTTGTSLLTFNVGSTAVAGSYPITINGVSGTISASTIVTLTVTGGGGGFACHVGYAITNQWQGGFGAALTINNTGTTAISSWSLTWSFANGQTVTQLWNGNVIQSGANVTVTNASYDGSIAAGGSLTSVGFNGSWNNATNAAPTSFAINGTTCN
ncbi:MAG: cellulose binding domain-containing protein [Terracidiphilus sp.]